MIWGIFVLILFGGSVFRSLAKDKVVNPDRPGYESFMHRIISMHVLCTIILVTAC